MTDIFLAYSRKDEARVARLEKMLEDAGLSVWWDCYLPGGERWQSKIESEHSAAKVVLVCWTHASVSPEATFVQDEAFRAGVRLVQVILERGARPPLGLGQFQAIDLSHWRGSKRDPSFQDLVELVRARLDGKSAPKPKGRAKRALQHFVVPGGLATAAIAIGMFFWSSPAAREGICTLPVAQPALSRGCCTAGFTEAPLVRDTAYTSAPVEKASVVRQTEKSFASEAAARRDAADRANDDAAEMCARIDQEFERLAGVEVLVTKYECREISGGWTCAADYRATCAVEKRELVQRCPG